MVLRLVFLGLVVASPALGGCGGTLQPPGLPVATIYVTSDGFHSSVIVPFDPASERFTNYTLEDPADPDVRDRTVSSLIASPDGAI